MSGTFRTRRMSLATARTGYTREQDWSTAAAFRGSLAMKLTHPRRPLRCRVRSPAHTRCCRNLHFSMTATVRRYWQTRRSTRRQAVRGSSAQERSVGVGDWITQVLRTRESSGSPQTYSTGFWVLGRRHKWFHLWITVSTTPDTKSDFGQSEGLGA